MGLISVRLTIMPSCAPNLALIINVQHIVVAVRQRVFAERGAILFIVPFGWRNCRPLEK
jgi:hypothetical protein